MDENIKTEEAVGTVSTDAGKTEETSQDPIQVELERVRRPKTEREKAEYTLLHTAKRLSELGADPTEILGIKQETHEESSSEVPEWYRREQAKGQEKNALQLADAIPDQYERDLVKHHLETSITGGTAEERLKIARGYVNSLRNAQIVEHVVNKPQSKGFSAAPGAPAKETPEAPELSKQEKDMDDWVFKTTGKHMTPDEIRNARGQK